MMNRNLGWGACPDHDVAGEVLGIELETLSVWQACALAREALAVAYAKADGQRGHKVAGRRLLKNALDAAVIAGKHFD